MIVQLAEAMYDKLYAESEEEIVYNLVGLLHIKDKFNEDGVCVGGSGDYEQYSWLSDMVYGIDFIDVFPNEWTKEQLLLLIVNAKKHGENWGAYVAEWIDRRQLEDFGIYDKMLTVWSDICHLREKKEG